LRHSPRPAPSPQILSDHALYYTHSTT
jgi:hypothetical protein